MKRGPVHRPRLEAESPVAPVAAEVALICAEPAPPTENDPEETLAGSGDSHRSVLDGVLESLRIAPVVLEPSVGGDNLGGWPKLAARSMNEASVEAGVGPDREGLAVGSYSTDGPLEVDLVGNRVGTSTSNGPRYVDLGLIGTGGMGEVRRVLDRDLNRIMAMKVIRPDVIRQPTAFARFLEEAQTTAQLEHPGIVPVHELGRLPDGRFYFTMKEVKGRTLKAVIHEVHAASPGPLWEPAPSGWTFRRLIDAFHKVCEAVAYAHSRGVVHRDLKPSNVMVASYGEVVVVDWGLARIRGVVDRVAESGALEPVVTRWHDEAHLTTHEGVVSGTPAYMPPEQARGEVERLGPASDVYALGAILYEILSSRPPYEGPDGMTVLGQVLAGPPAPPGRSGIATGDPSTWSSLQGIDLDQALEVPAPILIDGPPLPDELKAICLRAMARPMEERYPNGGAVAAALEAWLEDAQRRERAIKVIEEAGAIQPEVARLRGQADQLRRDAERMLAGVKPFEPIDRKRPGWALEDEARRLEREADLKELEFLQLLRASLTHVPDLPETHARLADYYREQHAAAESARDVRAAVRYEILLRAHDRGQHAAYLRGDGALTLISEPAGAEATLYRFVDRDRRKVAEPIRSLGRTPIHSRSLPMGSYLIKLKARGRDEVSYPVSIGRQEHWDGVRPGDPDPCPVYLPTRSELGPQDVYVPPGWFWCGGDPDAYFALPRRRVWVDGFVIRRFPVTNREYFAFLNDLVAHGRDEEALWWAPRQRNGEDEEKGKPLFTRTTKGRFVMPKASRGESWLADYPAILVDWHCAAAFAEWTASQTAQRWRLPGELEWEKAARGVDGRFFPWGDFVDPTWTCVLESHEGQAHPVAVDSFPVDESPYGVRGMGGNVRDWCLDVYQQAGPMLAGDRVVIPPEFWAETGVLRVIRGGAWANSLRSVRAAFRSGGPSTDRFALLGFRLVKSLEPPMEKP